MAFVPKAGDMRHVLKLERIEKYTDETGGQHERGVDWFTTRGYYRENSGARSFQNGNDLEVVTGTMWIYWRQAVENDLKKDVRIIYNNRFFEIQHFRLIDEKRKMYVIEVKEVS